MVCYMITMEPEATVLDVPGHIIHMQKYKGKATANSGQLAGGLQFGELYPHTLNSCGC